MLSVKNANTRGSSLRSSRLRIFVFNLRIFLHFVNVQSFFLHCRFGNSKILLGLFLQSGKSIRREESKKYCHAELDSASSEIW